MEVLWKLRDFVYKNIVYIQKSVVEKVPLENEEGFLVGMALPSCRVSHNPVARAIGYA